MELERPEERSKIPQHLKSFLRPGLITEPAVAQPSYSYTFSSRTSPTRSVELCPPHWRLPPKRSLRSTLINILLKDWSGDSPGLPNRRVLHKRPVIMRMKDSDDYITARAANPRTGLISPSIGTDTPRLPITPGSPGELLKRREDEEPPSPTPEAKTRPSLKRANEGRKTRGRACKSWRTNGNGWLMEAAAASPRMSDVHKDATLVTSKSQSHLDDDSFIMHMPSAEEPQPYDYPGYSAKQIAAFEHYRHKTRRVSSEGYDRRILDSMQREGSRNAGDIASGPNMFANHVHGRVVEKSEMKGKVAGMRGKDSYDGDLHLATERTAQSFAPFTSPRTPMSNITGNEGTRLKTINVPVGQRTAAGTHIHRKPVGSPRDHSSSPVECHKLFRCNDRCTEDIIQMNIAPIVDSPAGDLKHLPRVRLVHPALASKPQAHSHAQSVNHDGTRKCSLVCMKDVDGNACLDRRSPSPMYAASPSQALFAENALISSTATRDTPTISKPTQTGAAVQNQKGPQISDILVSSLICLLEICRNLRLPMLPRFGIVEILRAEHTTQQQKADALRTALSSTGQALVLLTVIAVFWQVGSAIMHVFEVLFWPLTVPFKIMRWLAGGK